MVQEEALRAALMQEAESVAQELVQWCRSTPQPTLTEMEDKVLALRQRLGERMLQVVLEAQAARHLAPGPLCAGCGQEMRCKGEKARWLGSRVGGVRLRRSYYYCATCRAGIFPPGRTTWGGGAPLE
jgi:hypothetical protein